MAPDLVSLFPEQESRHPSHQLLLVHGAWHAAWAFEKLQAQFAEHGYASHAINLSGHGGRAGQQPLARIRLADYVRDVEAAAAALSNPVLIGHSMGGLVVQKTLERRQAPAAVLIASVPPTGALGPTLYLAQHHPVSFLRGSLGMLRFACTGVPPFVPEALFSPALPRDERGEYLSRLQPESAWAILDECGLDLPRPSLAKTPILVLGAECDAFIRRRDVERTAIAYGTTAEFIEGASHDVVLDVQSEHLAQRIVDWLSSRPAALDQR